MLAMAPDMVTVNLPDDVLNTTGKPGPLQFEKTKIEWGKIKEVKDAHRKILEGRGKRWIKKEHNQKNYIQE